MAMASFVANLARRQEKHRQLARDTRPQRTTAIMSAVRLWTRGFVIVTITLFLSAQVPNLLVLAPRFLHERGFDARAIGIVMGTFNVASLTTMFWLSRQASLRHGPAIAVGGLLSALGAAGFWLAASSFGFWGYVAARLLQGAGFATVLVVAAAYVADTAAPGRLTQALGLSGVLTITAQAVGPALGEALLRFSGWSTVFAAGIFAGLGCAAVALRLPAVAGSEIPVAAGKVRRAWPVLAAIFLASTGFGAIWTFLSAYAADRGLAHVTPFFAAYVVGAVSMRVFAGHLPDRIGPRRVAVPALLLHTGSLLGLAHLSGATDLMWIGVTFGIAHGLHYPSLQALVIGIAGGPRSRAISVATLAFGGGVAFAAFGLGPVARAHGYTLIYWITAGAGVASVVAVLSLRFPRGDRSR